MAREDDGPFPSARDEAEREREEAEKAQIRSPSYRLAFADPEFLLREELRPVRLQLELWKPETLLNEHGIRSTVTVFGSTRIAEPAVAASRLAEAEAAARAAPGDRELARRVMVARRMVDNSRYYEEARRLAGIISTACAAPGACDFVVLTGGGPGIMEAANRGAADVGAKTVGLNVMLPREQYPNPYITPELSFRFHYFAIRKMHLLSRAKALVVFPGGFGTLDELFEVVTLVQTGKIDPLPILLFGKEFWERVVNLDVLADEGMIDPKDRDILRFVETAEEAWLHIAGFYKLEG